MASLQSPLWLARRQGTYVTDFMVGTVYLASVLLDIFRIEWMAQFSVVSISIHIFVTFSTFIDMLLGFIPRAILEACWGPSSLQTGHTFMTFGHFFVSHERIRSVVFPVTFFIFCPNLFLCRWCMDIVPFTLGQPCVFYLQGLNLFYLKLCEVFAKRSLASTYFCLL